MIVSQRILLKLKNEEKEALDNQSLLCASMYNRLLKICKDDEDFKRKYIYNNHGLRDMITKIKSEHPYYKGCSSYALRNTASRLILAYKSYFRGECECPSYFSEFRGWFSLLYDDPAKGVSIKGKLARVSIGNEVKDGRFCNRYLSCSLAEEVVKNERIYNYRITKEHGEYYLNICMEREFKEIYRRTGKRVAIDPNNSNFFMAFDSDGNSFMMENLSMIKYLNKKIDKVKRLRARCTNSEVELDGRKYLVTSRNYRRRTEALNKLNRKLNGQVRAALYMIARQLCYYYDEIAIGDYAPDSSLATNKKMRRSMINDSVIGELRRILEYECKKYNKKYIRVNEKFTTMKCPCCGFMEKKEPDIRQYRCISCHRLINRDIGSAINIGVRGKVLSVSDYMGKDLSEPMYTLYYSLHDNAILKRN